jgi:hypothetical protein
MTAASAQKIDALFDRLWRQYTDLNPSAREIHSLLTDAGEYVLNDHVAFRTYDDSRLGLERLAKPFVKLGYQAKDEYFFEAKKLYAKHYEHPDVRQPKVFISELQLAKCSSGLRQTVTELINQVPANLLESDDLCHAGRPWRVSHKTYSALYAESEYAGWLAAFGFCANHFTVFVNELKKFGELTTLNAFLKQKGFKLNASGGEIKGSPEVFLEQSSTMSREVDVSFTDGVFRIPSCYYEFAKRYPMPSGELYQGFVEKSADKIFESTNRM